MDQITLIPVPAQVGNTDNNISINILPPGEQ